MRGIRTNPEKERQTVELYRSGLSEPKVARKLDIVPSTVHQILVRKNEPRRSISDAITWYPKTDFSGDPAEQARLCGFVEDCHVRHVGKQISVSTSTTHPAQIKLCKNSFVVYGHVGNISVYNEECSLYQWQVYVLLNRSFEFLYDYKESRRSFLQQFAENGYEYQHIAGEADAESWVGIYVDHGYPRAALEITNNNRQLLEWTQKILGGRIHHDNDSYKLALYGGQAIEAIRMLPIMHGEKVAAKEIVLRHYDNAGIGMPALWEYQALRLKVDEEVRRCKLEARLDYIRRHRKPHRHDPDQTIPENLTLSPSFFPYSCIYYDNRKNNEGALSSTNSDLGRC